MRLTRNQQRALQQYAWVDRFVTPPQNRGQICEVSFGCTAEFIFERVHDRSCHSVDVTAFRHPAREVCFDPWNGEPEVGRRVGRIYSGSLSSEPGR